MVNACKNSTNLMDITPRVNKYPASHVVVDIYMAKFTKNIYFVLLRIGDVPE